MDDKEEREAEHEEDISRAALRAKQAADALASLCTAMAYEMPSPADTAMAIAYARLAVVAVHDLHDRLMEAVKDGYDAR